VVVTEMMVVLMVPLADVVAMLIPPLPMISLMLEMALC
jgi:hypothetical protein